APAAGQGEPAAAAAPRQSAAGGGAQRAAPRQAGSQPVAGAATPHRTRAAVSPAAPPATPDLQADTAAGSAPPAPAAAAPLCSGEDWLQLLRTVELGGPARGVATDAVFVSFDGSTLRLALPGPLQALCNPTLLSGLAESLRPALGIAPRIQIVDAGGDGESLGARERSERARRQQEAEAAFMADPAVRQLVDRYGARPVPDSIRPFDEV